MSGEGGGLPNWSQLLRTPMSFLPSRRATISFSAKQSTPSSPLPFSPSPVTPLSPRYHPPLRQGSTSGQALTIREIQKLRRSRKHLRRTLRARGRRGASARRVRYREVLHHEVWVRGRGAAVRYSDIRLALSRFGFRGDGRLMRVGLGSKIRRFAGRLAALFSRVGL